MTLREIYNKNTKQKYYPGKIFLENKIETNKLENNKKLYYKKTIRTWIFHDIFLIFLGLLSVYIGMNLPVDSLSYKLWAPVPGIYFFCGLNGLRSLFQNISLSNINYGYKP